MHNVQNNNIKHSHIQNNNTQHNNTAIHCTNIYNTTIQNKTIANRTMYKQQWKTQNAHQNKTLQQQQQQQQRSLFCGISVQTSEECKEYRFSNILVELHSSHSISPDVSHISEMVGRKCVLPVCAREGVYRARIYPSDISDIRILTMWWDILGILAQRYLYLWLWLYRTHCQ